MARGGMPALASLLLLLADGTRAQQVGFLQDSDAEYSAAFADLEDAAYDAPRPPALAAACAGQGELGTMAEVSLDASDTTSLDAQQQCSASSTCIVPEGSVLRMTSNFNVGALIIRGSLIWDDSSGAQWLCAGYIAVESGGSLDIHINAGITENISCRRGKLVAYQYFCHLFLLYLYCYMPICRRVCENAQSSHGIRARISSGSTVGPPQSLRPAGAVR